MRDSLGDRMKANYEDRTRILLPRRTYTLLRLDGKAFHTFTRGMQKPFDFRMVTAMTATAKALVSGIQGAEFAYVQSDEISLLLCDFATERTDAWFDGNLQKMVSVSASIATANFNRVIASEKLAYFDSRAFTIPDSVEVENYFVWRQKDAMRNSISAVAQSLYSHKELQGKSSDVMQEMIFQKGINWNEYEPGLKRGFLVTKDFIGPMPDILKEREAFRAMIPKHWETDGQ